MTDQQRDAEQQATARLAARLAALLPRLERTRREIARLQALEVRQHAEAEAIAAEWTDAAAPSDADLPHRAVAAEIGAAWRVSDRTVQRRLGEARTIAGDYPATLDALAQGRIALAHVRVIVDAGLPITHPELRHEFENAVLDYAESTSASRLAPAARRRAERFCDETVSARHARARADRSVRVTPLDDGMAELVAVLPSMLAFGVHDRLTRLAHAQRETEAATRAEDAATLPAPRAVDQLRADILADLLLTADPAAHIDRVTDAAAIRAHVQVTVPVLTLMGGEVDDPFECAVGAGLVPIDAPTARALAAEAPGWDRILTHPLTGTVLGVDRYRPSDQMRRHLAVRDRHCRFPGCRVPLSACDIDHTLDHQFGGETRADNLAHLCRRHHTLKHHSPWTVVQRGDGVLTWTSPTGRCYGDAPASRVFFAPDVDGDPVDLPLWDVESQRAGSPRTERRPHTRTVPPWVTLSDPVVGDTVTAEPVMVGTATA
jgi:hypothetical protein